MSTDVLRRAGTDVWVASPRWKRGISQTIQQSRKEVAFLGSSALCSPVGVLATQQASCSEHSNAGRNRPIFNDTQGDRSLEDLVIVGWLKPAVREAWVLSLPQTVG